MYQQVSFEPYDNSEQTRQPRQHDNNVQSQNPIKTQGYLPNQLEKEIPLPYYQQQHEIRKTQLKNFTKIPNAAESLQMTMNPY